MHLAVYVFLILFHAVSVSHGLFCTNRCDCDNVQQSDIIIINGVDDCCDATATPAKGNLNVTGGTVVTGCELCPVCGDPFFCEFDPITTVYSADITRPADGKLLFTITGVTHNCSGGQLFYSRGSTGDDLFTTVDAFGSVSIILANAPTAKRTYTGSITIQLVKNSVNILAETSVPFTFVLYDAIESDAAKYTAKSTNSRVGGLYLFTAGTSTPGFTIVFSTKEIVDYNSIFINSTSGAAFTSTTSPPTAIRLYKGVILYSYTSASGGGSPTIGQIEVEFSFEIVSPLTPSELSYSEILAFPLTPREVTAFVVTFDFEVGFSYSSFTYDFIDNKDILKINHITRTFSFPFESDTEIRRYPDSGATGIVISYFSVEMYTDPSGNDEPVYKTTFESVSYVITVVDPCGYSLNVSDTCVNGGTCILNGLSFICDCPVAFNGTNCEIDVNECLDTDFCNTGSCANTYGGFICTCTSGFIGVRCATNVDECLTVPSICLHGGVCSDSIGSYLCDCSGTGYGGVDCEVNINECVTIPNLCGTGVCNDNNGSYVCDCIGTGFRGGNCGLDINECTEQPGICQNNGLCINTNGSYICDCTNTGFIGDNCETNVDECTEDPTRCQPGVCVDTTGSYVCNCSGTGYTGANCTTDIDECSSNSSTACLNAGVCGNTNGGFTCDCANTGYKGLVCGIDVNECLESPPVCENNGNCFNTVGSYSCNCSNTGYEGSNCETNINECNVTSNICSTGLCIDTEGDYTCNCNGTGFVGNNCNIDVNECNLQPPVCLNNGACSNSFGGYSCNCGGTGYSGPYCGTDINECTENSTICNNGTCANTDGAYNCTCTTGFTGANCESDVDECDTADICNNGTCSNTQGSFACSCDSGYTGQLCDSDVNECSNVTDLCLDGICVNSIGSYSCDCTSTGYRGDNCQVDINECAENTTLCNQGNCTNTNGSFFCTCYSGFTGYYCSVNINECDDTADLCNNGTCLDTQGSYECECPSGITGTNCEEDINECLDSQLCAPGTCSNTIGSYTCDCSNTGFEGENCTVDINECTVNTGLCATGTCVNVPGSFSCNCTDTGFTGTFCQTDINECTTPSPCQNSGTCSNIPGSYQCNCNSTGFTGTDCETDIDECLTTGICNFGTCINIPGTYSCNCQSGYTGPDCTITTNATATCPSDKVCTNDSECAPCLCHRNLTYLEPVYVLLSEPLAFNGDILLPFEREIQPELVGDVTIYAKLRQDSYDQGYVMFIGSSTSYRNLGLFLDSNVSIAYLFYTQAGATGYTAIEVPLDVRNSTHTLAVVLNFTGGLAHFYKDGAHEASVSLSGTPDYKLGEKKNSRVMYVGGRIENLFKFEGRIEYLFLYPFCLTSSQIQYLHHNGPITYSGEGRCKNDVTIDTCVPRPFYKPSVPTQHHLYVSKTRCDVSTHYSARSLTGVYTCETSDSAVECSANAECASGYACGEYLSRDGHSFLPAVFDPYFHGFKYALVETETNFNGDNPITISITKRPILTLDLTIFVKFRQNSNNEGYVVAKGVSAHARDFGLYLRGTSDTVWFVYKSKSGFHDYAIFSNITVDDGQTHTMAAVLLQVDNSRFVYLYVDGLPRGCVKINNRVVFTPEINSLTVGGRPGTKKFNFDGVIYKLHIFDVALTFSVISDLHKAFTKNLLVRYCTHLQTSGDSCYIERRPPFFKCGSDLGCVPTPYFNRSIPVLPQQNICYGAPYTLGQCLSCDCPTPASNQLVCGINGVTYANSCFLACAGTIVLSQGACESYEVRFSNMPTGE